MMTRQRRRGLLLVSLAVASGGLAASEVSSRSAAVDQRVGPLVPVVAARSAIEPGTKLSAAKLTVVQVPARYAPPDALADPAAADGLRTAGALEPGSYVTASAFGSGPGDEESRPGNGLGRGERAIELKVAGADALGGLAGPGARVDVLITTETGDNAGRTALALEDVELLALKAGAGDVAPGPDAAGGGSATATLRVTLKQAVYLTAAQNFARETRLLPRAPGDRRRSGRLESTPSGL